jgi:hypothetical protein
MGKAPRRKEKVRNSCKISVGKPERKTPLGICKRRWEDNIKIDFREMGCECGMDSSGA